MKKAIMIVCVVLMGAGAVHADVIRMKSGRILIGKVVSLEKGNVNIEVTGEKFSVAYVDIVKTEKNISDLKDTIVAITLKDSTVIRGKIMNFDEDIGFLVEIDFGTITIPLEKVETITDVVQERTYVAKFTHLGVYGGAYFMVGDLAASFSPNAFITFFQEFNLDVLFEGLFTGYTLSYHNLYCLSSTSYSYALFNVNASIIYRLLLLRREPSFARNLVPYIALGAGVAVPILTYSGITSAEVDLSFTGNLGLDIFLNDDFIIRVNGGWLSILQSSLWFNSVAVSVGAAYSF